MLQDSLIYNWICRLCAFLGKYVRQSFTARCLFKIGRAVKAAFGGSGIANFVSRDGTIGRSAEDSLFYRLLDGLLNLPARILQRPYLKCKSALKASALMRLLSYLLDRLHVLIALFLAVALLVRHSNWYNKYTTMAMLAFFVLFLARTVRDGGKGRYTKALDVFLVLFAVCVAASFVFSILPSSGMNFLGFYFSSFILVFLLVATIQTKDQLMTVLKVVLSALTLCSLYGIYQGIMGVPVKPSEVDLLLNEGMPGRVFSTMGNPNNFGEILVMLLPFYLAVVFNARNALPKLFFLALAVPPLVALGMTYFRTGWIGFVVAVFVFVFFKDIRLIPVMLVLCALVVPFLPTSIYRRILTIFNPEDTSASYRIDIYRTLLPILKDYWVTGLGLGNETLKSVARNYYLFTKAIPPHSHNVYLQVWFEMGIAGILSLLAFLGSVIKRSMKAVYSAIDMQMKNVLIAGLSSLAGIMVISLAEYVWFYPRTMLIFWAVAGIILAALNISRKEGDQKEMAAESAADEEAAA